jgi:GNAT superfamily N-acetyltransferase
VPVEIRPATPGDPVAAALIREYFADLTARWWGRPASDADIERALLEEPSGDLVPPTGHFALAYLDGDAVGIGGVRFIDSRTAELTKVFTRPEARGAGAASALLDHLEAVAHDRGRSVIRLETRAALAEACRLYERRGYRRVPAFSESPYSDRWYALRLDGDA